MPHSPNRRFIKKDEKEVAVYLNSKGAKKFDTARSKNLSLKKKMKDGERYIAAPMPKNYHGMTHQERSEYYKNHKGSTGSTKVNPKTGKYWDTH